jgi:hypothetical protein
VRVAEQVVTEMVADDDLNDLNLNDCDGGEEERSADRGEPVYSVALTRERATVLLPGGRLIPYRHEVGGAHALPAG